MLLNLVNAIPIHANSVKTEVTLEVTQNTATPTPPSGGKPGLLPITGDKTSFALILVAVLLLLLSVVLLLRRRNNEQKDI